MQKKKNITKHKNKHDTPTNEYLTYWHRIFKRAAGLQFAIHCAGLFARVRGPLHHVILSTNEHHALSLYPDQHISDFVTFCATIIEGLRL